MEDIYLLHLMFVFDIDNSSEQSFRQMYTNMKPSDYYVYISKHIYNPCEQSFGGVYRNQNQKKNINSCQYE